jgi:hypothetical protein
MASAEPGSRKPYDLEERTARFGQAVIALAKTIPKNSVTLPLIGQLVRSGTSVGANDCEADDAESRKDFRHKIGICRKEALAPDGRRGRTRDEDPGEAALTGSQGTPSDLRQRAPPHEGLALRHWALLFD